MEGTVTTEMLPAQGFQPGGRAGWLLEWLSILLALPRTSHQLSVQPVTLHGVRRSTHTQR